MNEKGFFCFVLVLAFASANLSDEGSAVRELNEACLLAIEAERVNFVRNLMEEDTDYIVLEVLKREAVGCIRAPHEIKEEVNAAIKNYLQAMEGEKSVFVRVYNSSGQNIDSDFLNSNSSLVVKRLGRVCELEYTFHRGLMRREVVTGTVSGNIFSQEFKIPQGYTIRARGVAIV